MYLRGTERYTHNRVRTSPVTSSGLLDIGTGGLIAKYKPSHRHLGSLAPVASLEIKVPNALWSGYRLFEDTSDSYEPVVVGDLNEALPDPAFLCREM